MTVSTILLYGIAFVVLPFGTSWYEIPKVFIALCLIFTTALLSEARHLRWQRPLAILLIFFGLSLASLLISPSRSTFFGNPYRLQGILTFWGLLLWSYRTTQSSDDRWQSKIALGSLLLTLVFATVGRRDAAGQAVGSLGESNSLAAYTLFLSAQTGSFLSLIPALFILLISQSGSAVVGLVAGSIIWMGSHRRRLDLCVIVATLILTASLILPFVDSVRTFDSRLTIWRTAYAAGWEKPLFGWGVGNVEIGLQSAAAHQQTSLRYQYVDSSHNIFLDWWVQGGIVGLTSFFVLLVLSIRGLIRQQDAMTLASLYGILGVMLFNPVSITILLLFWWCVGRGMRKGTQYLSYFPHSPIRTITGS